MGRPYIAPNVLKAITDHPGEVIYSKSIQEETGYTHTQIRNVLWRFGAQSSIETVISGQAWRYVPNGKSESERRTEKPEKRGLKEELMESTSELRCFEELINVDRNTSVVRDDKGVVYQATLKKLGGAK